MNQKGICCHAVCHQNCTCFLGGPVETALRRCAILKAMGLQYDDLPGWDFTIVEQSAGVYRLTAARDGGIIGGGTDTDPDALLDEYKRWRPVSAKRADSLATY